MSTPRLCPLYCANPECDYVLSEKTTAGLYPCPKCYGTSFVFPKPEGVAAPLEPSLEENHHWKWFREIGQKLCPQAEQQWHKDDPHICRPCEFAKKVAELYAAAVSKNLQEELADMRGIISGLQDVIAGKTKPLEQIIAELNEQKS